MGVQPVREQVLRQLHHSAAQRQLGQQHHVRIEAGRLRTQLPHDLGAHDAEVECVVVVRQDHVEQPPTRPFVAECVEPERPGDLFAVAVDETSAGMRRDDVRLRGQDVQAFFEVLRIVNVVVRAPFEVRASSRLARPR